MYLPLMIRTDHLSLLLVGGGCVAHRKVLSLLPYDLKIKLVSPDLIQGLKDLDQAFTWIRSSFDPDHLEGVDLVVTATGDLATNNTVYQACKDRGIWCLNTSDGQTSDFHLPGLIQAGSLQVSVSTGGKSPAMTKLIKEDIQSKLEPDWEEKIDLIYAIRLLIKKRVEDHRMRQVLIKELTDLDIETLKQRRIKYENKNWIPGQ